MEELNLDNPLDPKKSEPISVEETPEMLYEQMMNRGEELLKKPLKSRAKQMNFRRIWMKFKR